MKYRLYQLYDNKAQHVAGPILIFPREAAAIREFHRLLSTEGTQAAQYPGDFDLLEIGTLDEETGMIRGMYTGDENGIMKQVIPEPIATGRGWLESQNHRSSDVPRETADEIIRQANIGERDKGPHDT